MKGKIIELSAQKAKEFLLPKHYSGRTPPISRSFGWYIDDELKAVVTYGKPASPSLCKGICGEEYADRVYELNRLCRIDGFSEPLSCLVSASLRRLRTERWIIVSFSDMAMNHHGYIYQACNFLYTGCTKARTDIFSGDGKHSRHYTEEDRNNPIRVVRSAKHRYVWFATYLKKEKEEWRSHLKYPVLPYPKGDNDSDYTLGNYIKQTLIDTRTGLIETDSDGDD